MNSFLLPQLFVFYRALPEQVRHQARQAYSLFQQDPHHPSLRFRQVHPTRPIFSARVGLHHRAVGDSRGQRFDLALCPLLDGLSQEPGDCRNGEG